MAFSYRTEVYRRNLQAQFQVGGQGYRWLDKVKLAMHTASVAAAPVRSGNLKASHRSYIRGINQWACRAEVRNISDHAEWVHEGTDSPIEPTDSEFLWVPVAPGAVRRSKRAYVRGQKSNPWLENACASVAMGFGAFPVS